MTLSAIVITKNAAATIERCLASVQWADEIIIVDSGSTDETLAICSAHPVQVHSTADWPGYGPQKNRALEYARCDWILSIDADEWLTSEARDEIERAMRAAEGYSAYALPRRSSFCGRYMKHSGWWPDYVVRLFRRGEARFSNDLAHEHVVVEGRVGKLRQPLMHEAVVDLEQMLGKMNGYSSASARMLAARGGRASVPGALVHGAWAFIRTYFLRLGVFDGREGFILAVANAEGSYYRYLKLMLLAEREQ